MSELNNVMDNIARIISGAGDVILKSIVLGIKVPIFLSCIFLWTFIGGFLWITYLARMLAIFFIGTLNAMLNRRTSTRGRDLDHAIKFFPIGYVIFFKSVFQFEGPYTNEAPEVIGIGRLIFEVFWAMLFWILNMMLLYLFLYYTPIFEGWFVETGNALILSLFELFERFKPTT